MAVVERSWFRRVLQREPGAPYIWYDHAIEDSEMVPPGRRRVGSWPGGMAGRVPGEPDGGRCPQSQRRRPHPDRWTLLPAVGLRPHDRGVRPPQRAGRPDPRAHRPGDWLAGATATGRRLPGRDLSRRPRARQATTAGTSNAATRAAVLPPYCLEVPGLSIIARCPAASSYVHSDTQV